MSLAPTTRSAARPLRAWQTAAAAAYASAEPRDFLVSATPGSGKTALGLHIAGRLLSTRVIQRVVVVTPTDALRMQWAHAAHTSGIALDPNASNAVGPLAADVHGAVVTYAQVAARPALHRARIQNRRTLVILDEVHHAGESLAWGDAVHEACDPARRRLSLSGTPFRSSAKERIPFIRYEPDGDGAMRSVADFSYGYREGLRDGVVRPVMFAAYAGVARWRNATGEVVAGSLRAAESREEALAAWRTVLDPRGEWVAAVLAAADTRLSELRSHDMPDAGGMVLASDQESARAYARLLERLTGAAPSLVLSDDPSAAARIGEFRGGSQRWMVAVRMVSEGVDVPRLAVGVYATSAATPLFFAQAVGRFVRARRHGETATVFLPAVPALVAMAAELERERDHVLAAVPDPGVALDELRSEPALAGGRLAGIEPLGAEASFDSVIFDGTSHTGEAAQLDADAEFLGLPGLLSPAQTAALLRKRDADLNQAVRRARVAGSEPGGDGPRPPSPAQAAGPAGPASTAQAAGSAQAPGPAYEETAALRREVRALVGSMARRRGRSHAETHLAVRAACGGPAMAQATAVQLRARRDWLLRELA